MPSVIHPSSLQYTDRAVSTCRFCGYEQALEGEACPLCGDVHAAPAGAGHAAPTGIPTVSLSPDQQRTIAARTRGRDRGPGETFGGRFRIEALLGRGGMGAVYRARDLIADRDVALKVLHPFLSGARDGLDRFRREASLLARMRHPAVPAVLASGEEDGEAYLVVELVEGEDLKSILVRDAPAPMPVPRAVEIVAAVADALDAAHGLGIVHRDVKPHNVRIATDGSVKLLDFGIARSVTRTMATITATDVTLGTPEYMSPEQLDSHRVDGRSDVYSLGVVLYELVTGRLPFHGDTPIGIALKHRTEIPPAPREIRPELPAWLERAILKCLEKDREKRFATAGELAAELRRPRGGSVRRRRLSSGDLVLEDDTEASDFALVLSTAREKTGWSPGMALLFETRHYRLVEAVPAMAARERWLYRFVFWPPDAVFRGLVDYAADAAERKAREDGQVVNRLKRWLSE